MEEGILLRIQAHIGGVSWDELNDVWPWRRVLRALDTVTHKLYEQAHPVLILAHAYLNVHRGKGSPPIEFGSLFLPGSNPYAEREEPIYSEAVIRAFSLAFSRGLTGNSHLSAMGIRELRASGWKGERNG